MARQSWQPYKHGFSRSAVVDPRGTINKLPLPVGKARTLASLSAEYAFFTPAILYLSGFFTDAMLLDFVAWYGRGVNFYTYRNNHNKSSNAIFAGLAGIDGDAWNYTLWAVQRPVWEPLQDFMCSVTITKPSRRLVVGIGYQELTILDPLALGSGSIVIDSAPKFTVGAFGINGNKFVFAFKTGNPLITTPTVQQYEPAHSMGRFADALFSGDNPNDARGSEKG